MTSSAILQISQSRELLFQIKEERLRKIFGEQGEITDCSLKFTKSGQFRKFAFIGFKTEDAAQAALAQFNQTFIDASKIQVREL